MLKGFWKLTWIEAKVFVREPMGLFGTLLVPVILFVVLGRSFGLNRVATAAAPKLPPFNVAILTALFLAISAVLSLTAIISIYREGGILKRLRATPLSPITILGSQVVLKLFLTAIGLGLLLLAGRRMFPGVMQVNVLSFSAAVLLSTASILSLGFVIASIVPTARFAQPIGGAILYPMLTFSGLFFPLANLPPALRFVASLLPTTHAVSLLKGIWEGTPWSAHLGDIAALLVSAVVCVAVSVRVFRWE